uniref:colicin D domain-containing protein n=1 Tax=Cellvibrio mixtus TaxID=39650 RepID=UPI00190F370B
SAGSGATTLCGQDAIDFGRYWQDFTNSFSNQDYQSGYAGSLGGWGSITGSMNVAIPIADACSGDPQCIKTAGSELAEGQATAIGFMIGGEGLILAKLANSAKKAAEAKKAADALSKITTNFSSKQLDKKFKHAADFGVDSTKKNPATLSQYEKALRDHLSDSNTVEKGTYGFVKDFKLFFNSNTNNAVVLDNSGNFVTGFKLSPGSDQFINYFKNGVLR